MALSETEKLERRYAENPQGLTFAPLAEVHRKNGDTARALELLRPGLTLHPDYIPASIVLGRCHLDLGELPAAEAAFKHVLDLDAENVIALKALADIAERMFRFDDAERMLTALLAVDRSNDEARDQVARVAAARQQVAAGSAAEPAPAPEDAPPEPAAEPSVAEATLPESAAAAVSAASPQELAPEFDAAGNVTSEPVFAWTTESGTAEDEEAPPEGIQLEQPVMFEGEVEPIAGLVGREEDAPEPPPSIPGDEFLVEPSEDIVLESSGGAEFQMANAAEELLVVSAAESAAAPAEPETAHEPEHELEPELEPQSERLEPAPEPEPEPEPVASAPAEPPVAEWTPPTLQPEPEPVITESMAELLLQQGYAREALTMYRHLEARSAGDPRLLRRIDELEAATHAHEPASAAPAAPGPAAAEPARPAWSVTATHGRSVKELLGAILAARPPAVPAGPAMHAEAARGAGPDREGAPTRPAHDSLSLSSVFGEESSPNAPAVPAAGAVPAAQGGVSFDEFFGPPAAPTSARPARAPDSKSDDLDQFHAWLQNLKR
jgi:tetratricopeptide (TPR) repeat protein